MRSELPELEYDRPPVDGIADNLHMVHRVNTRFSQSSRIQAPDQKKRDLPYVFVDLCRSSCFPSRRMSNMFSCSLLATAAVPQHERARVPLDEIPVFGVWMLSRNAFLSASNDLRNVKAIVYNLVFRLELSGSAIFCFRATLRTEFSTLSSSMHVSYRSHVVSFQLL